jgi:hypothetical protein
MLGEAEVVDGELEGSRYLVDRSYAVSRVDRAPEDRRYSAFAEMFLEEPVTVLSDQTLLTITTCTFRGIVTIDDW